MSKRAFHEQSRMEELVASLHHDDIKKFRDYTGNFLPLNEWDGVFMSLHRHVVGIDWYFECEGHIEFDKLPLKISYFVLQGPKLTGKLSLEKLPRELVDVYITNTEICGEIDLSALPENLLRLSLADNLLEGLVDMTCLPQSLVMLNLKGNRFGGRSDLQQLPSALRLLDLSNNLFTSDIFISKVPRRLHICLTGNPIDRDCLVKNCSASYIHEDSKGYVTLKSKNDRLASLTNKLIDTDSDGTQSSGSAASLNDLLCDTNAEFSSSISTESSNTRLDILSADEF